MSKIFGSLLFVILSGNNVRVWAVISHLVIDWILRLLMWVQVLSATGRAADWIRFGLIFFLDSQELELWSLSWNNPVKVSILVFLLDWSPNMTKFGSSSSFVGLSHGDIMVWSMIGNWVVNWILWLLVWMKVLGAAS